VHNHPPLNWPPKNGRIIPYTPVLLKEKPSNLQRAIVLIGGLDEEAVEKILEQEGM